MNDESESAVAASGRMGFPVHRASFRLHHSAFTLVELLVVLVILAALATIAVKSSTQTVLQGRYEAAKRGLRELDEAVVGPPNVRQGDGTALVTGFVADIGRLPAAVGADPSLQAAELWSNPNGLPAYGLVQSAADPEIWVEGGWRGPYVRLGIGSSKLRDGWGNPYDLLKPDGTAAAAGDPIAQVRSRGSDNQVDVAPSNDYTTDMTIAWTGSRAFSTVTGQVLELDNGNPMAPVLKSPSAAVTVKIYWWTPAGVQQQTFSTAGAGPCVYTLTGVPIGPRVIRAYSPDAASPTKRSPPIRFTVQPAGAGPNLILQ